MGARQSNEQSARRRKRKSGGSPAVLAQSPADAREQWAGPYQAVLPGVGQAQAALDSMRYDDSGRFVFCPNGSGSVHLYWKWHAGRWRGHYEYWFCATSEAWGDALQGLTDRVADVYAGRRKPKKDTPRPE